MKVIDLGQACPIGHRQERIQGTPDYIAPEQVKCEAVSPATDVFNFGATMYWALSGTKLPTLYTLKQRREQLPARREDAVPTELNPSVPDAAVEPRDGVRPHQPLQAPQ